MVHARWLSLALTLALASTARADVIPSFDYVPPPPPRCPEGAQPHYGGRGHGPGPCAAIPCATDAECGARGPCRETALCLGGELASVLVEPGQERPAYRLAPFECAPDGSCPESYECVRETRCVGGEPPAPPPPAPPRTPPTSSPAEPPATAAESDGAGRCSIVRGGSSRGAFAITALAAAAVIVGRRRRR